MSRELTVTADYTIVGHVNMIIDLHAFFDDGGVDRARTNRVYGSDLNVIGNFDPADVRQVQVVTLIIPVNAEPRKADN